MSYEPAEVYLGLRGQVLAVTSRLDAHRPFIEPESLQREYELSILVKTLSVRMNQALA